MAMEIEPALTPEFDSLTCLLLDIAQERSVDTLMQTVVRRLAERPPIALVRIWLLEPGDICSSCPMRAECPDHTSCLHLVASAGHSVVDPHLDWSYLRGTFGRIPLGIRKVGHIGKTGEQVIVKDIADDPSWIASPEWAHREGIRCFNGQPIIHKGNRLGVIAVFARIPLPDEAPVWLRMIADHVATAITNARAFEEIERLRTQLELENTYLREEVREAQAFGDLVGHSPALRNAERHIELVAPTDAGVLILGESGTGKELVAREIHRRSRRSDKPLIRVNCASIPRELYESEFFGHVKGSFTGAVKDRAGRFEAANGGTLFLDEVGEIPLELQSKLLRVLQEGQYERVGEDQTRTVNVRIVAATNRDLKKEVEAGRFRQDLYFRLNVFPIEISPLRQRKEDIPLLASHILDATAKKLNCTNARLTQANIIALQIYDWPGNVRELQNVIERAVITAQCGTLRFDLPGTASATPSSSVRPTPARSFTGAVKDRAGRFEAANGGTLFLDEVGEIPLELQSKLLRVLQEGQYERVGEDQTRTVNVRIVAATNRDLKKEVEAGRFRQDLYFRLNVFPIEISPLRQRKEDIPLLASHILDATAKKLNCTNARLTQANIIALQIYDWPGNVRELQNVIERAVITAQCGTLRFDLPGTASATPSSSVRPTPAPSPSAKGKVIPDLEMRHRERENILVALQHTEWKVYGTGGAAKLLGVQPTTLLSRIKKMGIQKPP